MKTRAVVFTARDQIEIRELPLTPMGRDEIRTETLYTFVSPGTELRTLAGHYGADRHYPIVPGYSTLERVVEVGDEVKGYRVGDLLSSRCGGGFTEATSYWGGEAGAHVYNPNAAGLCAPVILPEDAAENPLKYVVLEVAAISLRGVTSADPRPGENALVIGQGMIGSFVAEFLQLHGALVTVCDIDAARLAEAREAGFTCVPLDSADADERLKAYGSNGFDLVAECSGSVPGLKLAHRMIRKTRALDAMSRTRMDWPRLLLQANYVEEVPMNPCWFFEGEGVLLLTPGDRTLFDRQQVTELIRRGDWRTERFTRHVFTPDEMPGAYRMLQKREISSVVCKWF